MFPLPSSEFDVSIIETILFCHLISPAKTSVSLFESRTVSVKSIRIPQRPFPAVPDKRFRDTFLTGGDGSGQSAPASISCEDKFALLGFPNVNCYAVVKGKPCANRKTQIKLWISAIHCDATKGVRRFSMAHGARTRRNRRRTDGEKSGMRGNFLTLLV